MHVVRILYIHTLTHHVCVCMCAGTCIQTKSHPCQVAHLPDCHCFNSCEFCVCVFVCVCVCVCVCVLVCVVWCGVVWRGVAWCSRIYYCAVVLLLFVNFFDSIVQEHLRKPNLVHYQRLVCWFIFAAKSVSDQRIVYNICLCILNIGSITHTYIFSPFLCQIAL